MSKNEKLIKKLLIHPPVKDFRWAELCRLLESVGYTKEPGSRHFNFYNRELDDYILGVPRPHPGNEVKPHYLKTVRQKLQCLGLI